mmetsp:Transcript_37239/g.92626  ORF Transcript_37239/g.92626 Transcript_37239/m.92626 type:complete len:276 (+) Transcript_37239:366-1193(+)
MPPVCGDDERVHDPHARADAAAQRPLGLRGVYPRAQRGLVHRREGGDRGECGLRQEHAALGAHQRAAGQRARRGAARGVQLPARGRERADLLHRPPDPRVRRGGQRDELPAETRVRVAGGGEAQREDHLLLRPRRPREVPQDHDLRPLEQPPRRVPHHGRRQPRRAQDDRRAHVPLQDPQRAIRHCRHQDGHDEGQAQRAGGHPRVDHDSAEEAADAPHPDQDQEPHRHHPLRAEHPLGGDRPDLHGVQRDDGGHRRAAHLPQPAAQARAAAADG